MAKRADGVKKTPSRTGQIGYGTGPVLAAGVMVSGAVIFAGWGVTQITTADAEVGSDKDQATVAPVDEGSVTVTLPDRDGNGIADALESKDPEEDPGADDEQDDPADSARGEQDEDSDHRDDEPAASEGGDSSSLPDESSTTTEVYIIRSGDTLSEISGDTGVPIDRLIEANGIQNPNLIYAGASLLIPPV